MSVSEPESMSDPAPGIQMHDCALDIVDIAALRGRVRDLTGIAAAQGLQLPAFGRATMTRDQLALSVRPGRWLLLSAPADAGSTATRWQSAVAECGVAVDLSSGLSGIHLTGAPSRDMLACGCRLDLDPASFGAGSAAATVMAQVAVILVGLPSGMLLLTPSTTARHFREWLASAGSVFGLAPRTEFNGYDLFRSALR